MLHNYYKMVEELEDLINGGMGFDNALNEVREEHDLDDEEIERLKDEHLRYCYGGETEDCFSVAEEVKFSEDDDFFGENLEVLMPSS